MCATLLDMDDYEADVVELGGEISFDTWKDLKIRNAQGECVPCKKHGVDRKLTSAQKSYYHWSDGCKTSSCSIKACPYVRDVAGLQEWARKERDKWHEAKATRDRLKDLQKQKDRLALEEAANVGEESPSRSRSESPSLSRSKPSSSEKAQPINLTFTFKAMHQALLDEAIANHIVEDAMPLTTSSKLAFREMIDKAIAFGHNCGTQAYAHPGRKRVRDELIPTVVRKQARRLSVFESRMDTFGATLASDAKDDVCKDHLVNYVTVTPDGYRWEASIDVSGIQRQSEWVANDLLQKVYQLEGGKAIIEADEERRREEAEEQEEEVESKMATCLMKALKQFEKQDGLSTNPLAKYVQVVTDTPSVNAKAWTLIEEKSPHLLANPCIFHCMNLHFKHVLKGDKSNRKKPMAPILELVDIEEWTKVLEKWFTNKEVPRALLLKECKSVWPNKGPRRMRKYSDTRAANAWKVWHRTLRVKACLFRVIMSGPYMSFEQQLSGEDEEKATEVRCIIEDREKWKLLADVVAAMTPAYKLLRMVDSFAPAVGKVFYKAQRLQEWYEEIAWKAVAADENDGGWQQELLDHWTEDWAYMHVDLHSLGYHVDPEYHSHLKNIDAGHWKEFLACASRMQMAAPEGSKAREADIGTEFAEYENLTGMFTKEALQRGQGKKAVPGHVWWQQWGKSTPGLRFVAMRALAQTASASCSEQAWSEYDGVHTRKRNRLTKRKASELTRGHNQARLIRKLQQVEHKPAMIPHTDSDDDDEEAFFSD